MKLFTATLVATIGLGLCAVPRTFAKDDSFVGKWKFNPDKSTLTGQPTTIEDLGGDKFKISFGDDSQTIVMDGKEYPNKFGGMWSVKKEGANTWKSVRTRDGKVTSTSAWTISEDGKTWTTTTDGTRADGSTVKTVSKSKRIAGTSGLAGTWEDTDVKIDSTVPWEIAAYEGDGMSFIRPGGKARLDFKFDGKDYSDKGPRVAEGSTASAKRIDSRTIEMSWKLKDKLMDTERMEVSEDGKTLTSTNTYPGVEKKEVRVHERQ